jgi:hypothetical protein
MIGERDEKVSAKRESIGNRVRFLQKRTLTVLEKYLPEG